MVVSHFAVDYASVRLTQVIPPSPHPRWQHSEVEEDRTVPLVEGQCTQLGDGFQGGKCFIDRDS